MHAEGSFEHGFPLIFFFDKDVVKAPPEVHLGEQCFPLKVIDYAADQGERIDVSNCPGIEGMVHHQEGQPILRPASPILNLLLFVNELRDCDGD
jgi:hypothetical protein